MSALEDLINLDLSDSTNKIIAEYIWIGGSGLDMRSKARTLPGPVKDPSELPKWNYDGSSTGQAPGTDSEVILYPQAIFKDPFRRGNNILVMCDAYTPAGEPIPTNKRHAAANIFNHPKVLAEETWYGIEQEYTLLQKDIKWPVGWPIGGFPGPQGPYYCGVGADKAFGRDIVDAHYKACLYAGINISGTNGEVMPGQWEFQVGPTVGIAAADQVWVARYILEVYIKHTQTLEMLVPWMKQIWFPNRVPRHSFMAWLFTLDRCPTRDRLLSWGYPTDPACLLCNTCGESRNHLFFNCDFSFSLWNSVCSRLHIRPNRSWDTISSQLASLSGSRNLHLLTLLAWQASLYLIWIERNNRYHRNQFATADSLFLKLDRFIRDKALSYKLSNPTRTSLLLNRWFSS